MLRNANPNTHTKKVNFLERCWLTEALLRMSPLRVPRYRGNSSSPRGPRTGKNQ